MPPREVAGQQRNRTARIGLAASTQHQAGTKRPRAKLHLIDLKMVACFN